MYRLQNDVAQSVYSSVGRYHIFNFDKKQKIFSEKQNDLGMACHIPPLKKAKKQGEMPLPSLGPIP